MTRGARAASAAAAGKAKRQSKISTTRQQDQELGCSKCRNAKNGCRVCKDRHSEVCLQCTRPSIKTSHSKYCPKRKKDKMGAYKYQQRGPGERYPGWNGRDGRSLAAA